MNLFEKIAPIEYEEKVTEEQKLPETNRKEPEVPITDLPNMREISFGGGGKSLHITSEGLWVGADKFEEAPFNVDMTGKTNITPPTTPVDLVSILSAIYYIGSIHIATVDVNPGKIYGFGTWVSFGSGKMLIGLDSSDATMDTAEETGGAKTTTIGTTNMPSHTHKVNPPSTTSGGASSTTITAGRKEVSYNPGTNYTCVRPDGYSSDGNINLTAPAHTHAVDIAEFDSGSAGSGTAITTISPFVVVYFWKRTA